MSRKIRVLMVDDEDQFRETTEKILSRRGFETIMAASGEEALSKLDRRPDVVILDIKMPGMGGHETLKEIKNRFPALPVIMLTGHGGAPSAQEALSGGAFDYLSKPCDIDLLTVKIQEACQGVTAPAARTENCVRDVMVPIADYTTLEGDRTVAEAIRALRESFAARMSSRRIMETGHRSIVVFDRDGSVIGILAICDLLGAVMPGYLSAPKPSTADSIQYSPMFWSGMFTREVDRLARKKVEAVMSPAPVAIEADVNLMEAAYRMTKLGHRRLAVVERGEVIGILREQDLFFEMEKILAARHRWSR
jgi:CheY-like chemotaxis protein/CBS domain-containing protein